jgi:hypothetical protein
MVGPLALGTQEWLLADAESLILYGAWDVGGSAYFEDVSSATI